MSTPGTRESCRDGAAMQVAPEMVWVVVKVERGFPEEVRAFRTEEPAQVQLRRWRKKMNPDYDETGLCDVVVNESQTKHRSHRSRSEVVRKRCAGNASSAQRH